MKLGKNKYPFLHFKQFSNIIFEFLDTMGKVKIHLYLFDIDWDIEIYDTSKGCSDSRPYFNVFL